MPAVCERLGVVAVHDGKTGMGIPSPFQNPVGEAKEFYTIYYARTNEHDSPKDSRRSLVQRVYPFIARLPTDSFVLDLGAGRQAVEEEYDRYKAEQKAIAQSNGTALMEPVCRIITLDIAELQQKQLAGNGYAHLKASGDHLPFRDGVFEAVISNMAFDFMPPAAKDELYRVLKPGGQAFLNLHHPSRIPFDTKQQMLALQKNISRRIRSGRPVSEPDLMHLEVLRHKRYLQDNRMLFYYEEDIQRVFEQHGFIVERVSLGDDGKGEKWWEADLVKPQTPLTDEHSPANI